MAAKRTWQRSFRYRLSHQNSSKDKLSRDTKKRKMDAIISRDGKKSGDGKIKGMMKKDQGCQKNQEMGKRKG